MAKMRSMKKLILQTCGIFAILYLLKYLLKFGLRSERILPAFEAKYSASIDLKAINRLNITKGQNDREDKDFTQELPSLSLQNSKPANLFEKEPSFDFKAEMDKLNKEKVADDDPRLIDLIRNYYMEPPSELPYNLTNSNRTDFSRGQGPFVDSSLQYLESGFFVECGAFTGEKGSNSLFFERTRKWSGLLVEPNPMNYAVLKTKHRKAFSINACLNTKPYPEMKAFDQNHNIGRLLRYKERAKKLEIQVQCFPFYSLLLALNTTSVDFFSLDIEGDEVDVLQTIPWDKVDIKMMTVEFAHGKGGKEGLRSYVHKNGYESLTEVVRADWGANDIIFKKKT